MRVRHGFCLSFFSLSHGCSYTCQEAARAARVVLGKYAPQGLSSVSDAVVPRGLRCYL